MFVCFAVLLNTIKQQFNISQNCSLVDCDAELLGKYLPTF
jgi:hypothetical protein